MKYNRFTLVELLVAIVIIAILGGIVASGSEYIQSMIKEATTKSQIQRLELALEKYKAEYEVYYTPSEVTSSGTVKFFDEAREFNPNPKPTKMKFGIKTVLKMDAGMVKFCSRSENLKGEEDEEYTPKTFLGDDYTYSEESNDRSSGLRDGWGNLLMYRCPGKYNKTKFDIWSRGADGEDLPHTDSKQKEDDDITNWKLQK